MHLFEAESWSQITCAQVDSEDEGRRSDLRRLQLKVVFRAEHGSAKVPCQVVYTLGLWVFIHLIQIVDALEAL